MASLIVGPGAIGHCLAFWLQQSGERCYFMDRFGYRDSQQSIEFEGKRFSLNVSLPPNEYASAEDLSAVYLTVPAYALDSVAVSLEELFPKRQWPMISFANGYVREIVERRNLFWGVSTFGACFEQGNLKITNDQGAFLVWGEQSSVPATSVIKCQQNDFFLAKKWIANTVCNTIACFFNLDHNGEILQHPKEMKILLRQSYQKAQDLFEAPLPALDQVRAEVSALIERTFNNQNSMVQAMRRSQPLEWRFLFGKLDRDPSTNALFQFFLDYDQRIQLESK